MPILIDTDSEDSKERRKWEQFPTVYGSPGNPYKYRPFPAMLYKAHQVPPGLPGAGKFATGLPRPSKHGFRTTDEWDAACMEIDNFVKGCQRIVNSEEEFKRAIAEGWCEGSDKAVEKAHEEHKALGQEAAERNYRDRNMSEAAKAESAAAEAEHFGHLPSVPEKPIKRRGRKPAAA